MNKELFKCILSIICITCGGIMSLLSLLSFDPSSPAFIACILLGISLMVIGGISCILHYRGHKIITQLQNKEVTILAHWHFAPLQFEGIKESIEQDRSTNLSIVILLGVLSCLIALGLLFSDSPFAFVLCVGISMIGLVTCTLSCILIYIHYHNKLIKPIEAIIGENYIYYHGDLYSLERSLYLLNDVKLVLGDSCYLQFFYGSPCTLEGPVYSLSIPIPSDQLEVAKYIREHYLNIIH
ncbi:MAG: hypothetical protein ACRC1P_09020 [Cellulosilyticaceae bacterium]